MVIVAAKLMNPATRDAFVAEIRDEYRSLRDDYLDRRPETRPIEEARKNKLRLFP